jgi:hypothetical protein
MEAGCKCIGHPSDLICHQLQPTVSLRELAILQRFLEHLAVIARDQNESLTREANLAFFWGRFGPAKPGPFPK